MIEPAASVVMASNMNSPASDLKRRGNNETGNRMVRQRNDQKGERGCLGGLKCVVRSFAVSLLLLCVYRSCKVFFLRDNQAI